MAQRHACMATHRLAHGPSPSKASFVLSCLLFGLVDTHLRPRPSSWHFKPPRAASVQPAQTKPAGVETGVPIHADEPACLPADYPAICRYDH
jgi:hypothetical protein